MTASAGRQPAENKSASTEGRRVEGFRAVGRRLWVANPLARKNSDATERLIGASVLPARARIRGGRPGPTARAVDPVIGLP
jgi:hypothetical protein